MIKLGVASAESEQKNLSNSRVSKLPSKLTRKICIKVPKLLESETADKYQNRINLITFIMASTSNEETIIMENHDIKTIVHEMKVNGYHLVERKTMERKQKTVHPNASDNTPKMTIFTHSRSIDDRSYAVQETRNWPWQASVQVVETQMTQEQVERFEEDWSNLWKPQRRATLWSFLSFFPFY